MEPSLVAGHLGVLDRDLMRLALGIRQGRARLRDPLRGLIHGVDARGQLRLGLRHLSLGLDEPPLRGLDRRARRLVRRLRLVEVAPRDQLTLEELPEPLQLAARLTLRTLRAGDVGAHRGGRRLPRPEPRARLGDRRLARAHCDERPLEVRPHLLDRGARPLARQRDLGTRRP